MQASGNAIHEVGECEDVDMDIDMMGGMTVGRVDVRVTIEEARGLGSLQISNVKIESNEVIPPGFEELHRVRIQSSSSSLVHDIIPPGFEDAYRLRNQDYTI